ncbi:orotate phosphoribosyltransferase [Bathymodiolus platifrons methanotrophic gill symbiont]|uniref:orotate phosphoribosyltransferase n=1 Tax=Bathymodiolus platifrons methanotrophic gill symbiont TaxID=113268 RepID=UPI000B40EF41|nr:orotate phosphoribosyltransferase [Bathymodiolus platifrons methanotrophic gill symbiont]TXL04705.1 orotate phosphoribosyltransferase [Methylococcaceae bacterium CS1]TXL13511.1 orotate phosphoribosyltransferase [Methylococcaceae bacterium HT4]TXL20396.1 orotate phosphoribosyltransferase [Methylococcaceae bacterium HT5]GAW86073.1 orotate phosphoribosyltransferase [Bathymodiolus platifrons methanotrophic gill symbiont]GFO74196.1 orotate phosphoribosyltransferase [Bathymodiolus platifrons meth
MLDYQKQFIQYSLDCGVLKFGEFQLKSGRTSPYFFNTGLFNSGAQLAKLGQFYAQALIHSGIKVDVLYGPAYKGIPLVSAASIAYAQMQNSDIPFAFNRKEAKDHGEGGNLVGAPLKGNVLILDDVITAGTSVRESVVIINAAATPAGVLIALDRQEKGENDVSAIEEITERFNIPVISIIALEHIITFIEDDKSYSANIDAIREYQQQYGI